ncbi:MAG: tRNA (adenine-N(1)-)-methyltransferase catalytic subunit trm61 [Claussenomyces sp. TS43310]|nr:MAG: tRNA (adenine-N(1)-)-methyltransferase catalytic subunit trm61 [Claussenomyces sp. TS43310]
MAPRASSPFLSPGTEAAADNLAVLYLKRDLQMPAILRAQDDNDEGYAEGKVTNTRFGSFPHSTLIGLPWGSQVRASKVDTGSRGRRTKGGGGGEKRKREDDSEVLQQGDQREDSPAAAVAATKEAEAATSGFVHLLAPTPENWTASLPHRTQVVYTPDYSYVLHRLRARPGAHIIEAGAGSGSFTHASARAVFSGYPDHDDDRERVAVKKRRLGKVWSYEFHEQRHQKLVREIQDHGLEGVVEMTHRDVCEDGFLVHGRSPNAEAIFLDLPAPWLALPHLTRRPQVPKTTQTGDAADKTKETLAETSVSVEDKPFVSALNPEATVHLCTFSPCIEQVQRTVSTLRRLGWVGIDMVEMAHRRLDIRRERVGLVNGLERGVMATAGSVEEATERLREVEGRLRTYHEGDEDDADDAEAERERKRRRKKQAGPDGPAGSNPNSKEKLLENLVHKKMYKEGRLLHRTENEVKTHTSYLVFAVLPREWTQQDEERARERWAVTRKPVTGSDVGDEASLGMSKRQLKKAARQAHEERGQLGGANKIEVTQHSELEETELDLAVGPAMAVKDEGISNGQVSLI